MNVSATSSAERQRIRKGGFGSKADAELWAKPCLRAKLEGQRFVPSRMTLAGYWPDWIKQRSTGKRMLKPSTLAVYELYGREIVDSAIAQMPLTDVRRSDVQHWIDELAAKRGPQRKLRQNQDRLRAGEAWRVSDYVFTTQLGEPLLPEYPSRQLGRLAKAAGLPDATLHSLRHQHATALRETGSDGFLIAVRLGHAQAALTSCDAHVSLASQLEAAARAEGYFPAALSSQQAELSTRWALQALNAAPLEAAN